MLLVRWKINCLLQNEAVLLLLAPALNQGAFINAAKSPALQIAFLLFMQFCPPV